MVRSITVHSPNCDYCGGLKYMNRDPKATYDIEMFTDGAFHLVHGSQAHCKLALLWEPPIISGGMYNDFRTNPGASSPFHKVYTVDPGLIQSNPSKFTRYLVADSWVRSNSMLTVDSADGRAIAEYFLQQAYRGKRNGVSMIFSSKQHAVVSKGVFMCVTRCTGHAWLRAHELGSVCDRTSE